MHSVFTAALFITQQPRHGSNLSVHQQMNRLKKLWYVCTMEYYSAIKKKKNEILPSATTWMDLDGIMHSKTSKTEEDKYCMISLIYGV